MRPASAARAIRAAGPTTVSSSGSRCARSWSSRSRSTTRATTASGTGPRSCAGATTRTRATAASTSSASSPGPPVPSVPERPVLAAPDSFKGTFRATEVAAAIGRGLERAGLMPPDLCPVADGGEGTLEALVVQLGGETAAARVRDPLGREIRAGYALIEDGGVGIVEMAAASGLGLVADEERDAWAASTYGTGELIAAAVDAGAQVVLVGVGGSATTDGGAGAIEAIEAAGGLRGARLVVLTDVRVPFEAAPRVFAPQKGADPDTVRRLEERLDALAGTWARDPRGVPMTGAAGGLSG